MSFGKGSAVATPPKWDTSHWDQKMRFVQEYLRDHNATQAALRAGSPKTSARVIGGEYLRTPWIRDLIQRGIDRRWREAKVDTDDVLKELKRLAFANIWNYLRLKEDGSVDLDFSALSKDSAAGIVRITIDYQPEARSRAKKKKGTGVRGQGTAEKDRPVRKITVQLADKLKALELLGKTKNLFWEDVDENKSASPSATIDAIIQHFQFDKKNPQELQALYLRVENAQRRGDTSLAGIEAGGGESHLPSGSVVVDADADQDVRQSLDAEED